jgi:NADH:ubiquinone reductase (H+-translocating)
VILAEVTGIDLEAREVTIADLPTGGSERRIPFDTLVVAAGARYSYFGHDDWAPHAPELKSLDGAIDLRNRILSAFEAAELETDPDARAAWLTFVVVGAGPTGVEMAGQIAELGRQSLRREYRNVDTRAVRVLLVEALDRVLSTYPPSLSRKADAQLRSLGVTPLVDTTVVGVAADHVELQTRDGTRSTVAARTAVWAAGVQASPVAALLAEAAGLETDRAGRITVEGDLTVSGHPNIFAIGDMTVVRGLSLHGVAPVAMQQGRHVAHSIATGERTPFHYRDKGELATIGRSRAIGVVKGVRFSGFVAWALWLGIHITYLTGVENRLVVISRWVYSYFTRGRSARVIHGR